MQPVQAQMPIHKNYKMPFIICLSIAAVLMVILVIESILVLKNKQRKQKFEHYDCPCKAQLAEMDEIEDTTDETPDEKPEDTTDETPDEKPDETPDEDKPDETPDEKGTTDASPDEIREDAAESYRRLLSYRK